MKDDPNQQERPSPLGTSDPYEGKEPHIRAVDCELDRQLLAQARSATSNASRASVLIAAAGVTLSFSGDARIPVSLVVVAGMLGLGAVACGIVALWPREGTEHDVQGTLKDVWNVSPAEAVHIVFSRKLETRRADDELLFTRARWVRYGFMLYGACIVTTVVGNIVAMEMQS